MFQYIIWTLLWIGWNIFVICLYMEVGILSRDSSILNIGTGSRSWWEANGFGCDAVFNYSSSDDILAVTKPVSVNGCLLQYYYIECIQAGLQCLLAFVGFVGGCYLIYLYTQEDDSFDFIGGFDSYSAYITPPKPCRMQHTICTEKKKQQKKAAEQLAL